MNFQNDTQKKLTIFLLAVATLFTFVLLIHPYRKNDSSLLSDKLLRFASLQTAILRLTSMKKMS